MSSDFEFLSGPSTSRAPQKTSPPPLDGEHHLLHSTKKKKKQRNSTGGSSKEHKAQDAPFSLKGQILQLLAMAMVAWLVAAWGFKSVEWVNEQLKPFCDSYSTSEAETSDKCIPCPENGSCKNGRLDCFVGFKKAGRLCVNDKEIDLTAEKLAGYLRDRLCGVTARAICDGASGAVWVDDDEAQAQLKEEGLQEHFGLDEKSWLLVWEKMARIAEDSNSALNSLDGKREFKCPSELIQRYKPMKCRIREWIVANLVTIFIASPLVFLVASFLNKCLKRRKTNARAEQVYLQVCEALEEKALESREMAGAESWVVVSRLRDHILWPSERKWTALWRKVEDFVKEDSRIDQYQKKVKGEMKIVWEWQVEGGMRTPGLQNKVHQKHQLSSSDSKKLSLQI